MYLRMRVNEVKMTTILIFEVIPMHISDAYWDAFKAIGKNAVANVNVAQNSLNNVRQ